MGKWRSVRLEFRSPPPTRLPQLATDYRSCMVEATTKLWTRVLLTPSQIWGTVQLQACKRTTSWFRRWPT
jgi:hypothetical protein